METRASTDRLELIDALRGFALFGVFFANLFIFAGRDYMDEERWGAITGSAFDRAVGWLQLVFVETKFMGLFACLFGVSFWLFLGRANARGADGTRLFVRRVLWLFVIGCVHGWLLWCFDILRFYALFGLLLPLFVRRSLRTLLIVALFCAILGPALINGTRAYFEWTRRSGAELDAAALAAFSSGSPLEALRVNWRYDWYLTLSVGQIAYQLAVFGRLLLGLCAARAAIFVDVERHVRMFRILFIAGAIVGVTGNVLDVSDAIAPSAPGHFLASFAKEFVAESGYLGLTVAYASGLALLFRTAGGARVLRRLAPVGRMALTLYLAQTVFGIWLFYGCAPGPHWMGRVGSGCLLAIALTGFAVQIALANAWLRRFRFGPAEWLWRCLTYGKIQPFRAG